MRGHIHGSLLRALLAVALFSLALVAGAAPPDAALLRAAIEAVKPALVRIHVVEASFSGGREVKNEAYGSGVIISKEGYVVTNHHVAGHATYAACTMENREEIDAVLVGSDPLTDIAILKLTPPTPREFPFARFGDSDAVQVGDSVFAMGSPLAFSQSVTMGVVSNTELIMSDVMGTMDLDGEDVGAIVRWIGHDAAIFHGNSGGPLVNTNGEVIGINEISVGLGGAIPGNLARDIAEHLIKDGKVSRCWMGIVLQPLLRSMATAGTQGVLVADAVPRSPAELGGLRAGDILTKVGTTPVSVRFREELPPVNQMLVSLPVGVPIALTVLRGGVETVLHVTPAPRPELNPDPSELRAWGMVAMDLPPVEQRDLGQTAGGVRVDSVRPGGAADSARPPLSYNDIIVAVAGQTITNVADLTRVTATLTAGKTDPVPALVEVRRGEERVLTVAQLGFQETAAPGREMRRAWFPATTQVLTRELADALGLTGKTGVRVTLVYPDTTAVGVLRVGDIITQLDGEDIEASLPEDDGLLVALIRQYKVGSKVELTLWRDKTMQKVSLEIPAAPKSPREMDTYEDLPYQFSARDISFLDRAWGGWDATVKGTVVDTVEEGGWASLGRIMEGDLILAVNGKATPDVATLKTVMADVAKAKPTSLVVQVRRDRRTTYLEWRASWPATAPAP
jgi:serine protease Do